VPLGHRGECRRAPRSAPSGRPRRSSAMAGARAARGAIFRSLGVAHARRDPARLARHRAAPGTHAAILGVLAARMAGRWSTPPRLANALLHGHVDRNVLLLELAVRRRAHAQLEGATDRDGA